MSKKKPQTNSDHLDVYQKTISVRGEKIILKNVKIRCIPINYVNYDEEEAAEQEDSQEKGGQEEEES